jgi:hypothetical protein
MAWKWFPFISLRSHIEALVLKEEQVTLLKAQLAEANHSAARAMGMYERSVGKLTEALTPKIPAPEPIRSRRTAEPEEEKPKTLNLRDVNPNDNQAIMRLALAEMPQGKKSATLLTSKMEAIRTQILSLQAEGPNREMGTVPGSVMAMIEAAEAEGVAQAQMKVG